METLTREEIVRLRFQIFEIFGRQQDTTELILKCLKDINTVLKELVEVQNDSKSR